MLTRITPGRLIMLSAIAAVLGLAGGGAAYALIHLIGFLTNLLLFHRIGWNLPSLSHLARSPLIVVVAVGGATIVAVMARWAPMIKGHGIPEAMEAVLTNESRIDAKTAIAKPVSAAIAIGTSGPFGAEGPIIVTGGALGSLVGQLLPVSPAERKILLACGAAAGMAATFGSPLAAVILAIELLLFEFSARAFVPLVVASSLAAGVHDRIIGAGPLFAVPPHHYQGLDKLPVFALMGAACGLLAVVTNKGLFAVENGFRRLPVGEFWHPIIGAVGFSLVGLILPRALGVGYDQISAVLLGKLAVGTVVLLGLVKLVAWWIALASGTSGGTLAPLLLISGCFGSLFGTGVEHLFPGLGISPGGFAIVAMAATFGASVGATFTAIVFVFELTRDYHVILPLMLASVVAELVASAILRDSIMTEKLTRRGLHVVSSYQTDPLATTTVGEVMSTDLVTLPDTATVGDAQAVFREHRIAVVPIVDGEGACAAMLEREDIAGTELPPDRPVLDVSTEPLVSVKPTDTVLAAVAVVLTTDAGHLAVTEGDRLVGLCTRTDILRSRMRGLLQEEIQAGWRPRSLLQWRRAEAAEEAVEVAEAVEAAEAARPAPTADGHRRRNQRLGRRWSGADRSEETEGDERERGS